MSTTNQIADALEKRGIPFVRVEGVADGIEYWGLTVIHENIHAEVRECADWVEMKVWHYTPEQFMNMLVGAGTCKRIYHPNRITRNYTCSNCGYGASDERWAYCPKCGHKYVHGEVEERWKSVGRKVAE